MMIDNADTAMYEAKAAGRRALRAVHPEMRSAARERTELGAELSRAIADKQLTVDFQPLFSAVTRRAVGAEALVRWHHPEHGSMEPTTFVRVAEESGAIARLGEFVLERALIETRRWIEDGVVGDDFAVHVNVSQIQLASPSFVNLVHSTLRLHDLGHHRLVLEARETALLGQNPDVDRSVRALRRSGIQIAIDNFGTGANALSVLTDVGADLLKLDGSLGAAVGIHRRRHSHRSSHRPVGPRPGHAGRRRAGERHRSAPPSAVGGLRSRAGQPPRGPWARSGTAHDGPVLTCRHLPGATRYPDLVPLPPPPPPESTSTSTTTTCYRHPDRPAGRRCTRCGKPACDSCLVQATVGSHCPDCVKAARPDARTRARFWSARQPILVTMSLIAINVAIFVYVFVVTREPAALSGGVTDVHLKFGLSKDVLVQPIAWQSDDGSIYITEPDGWYRLVTSGFLHFGILHLAFNMYFLYILGPMLEPALGRINYLLLYMASLLGGSLGVVLLDSGGITAGASGAVFGLLAAATVGLWRRGVNPFTTGVGTALILNLFITFAIPGISIGGHLGGAIAGAVCGAVMLAPAYRRGPAWTVWATPVAVGIGSVVAVIAIVNAA